MNDQIICPNCKQEIPLTEALSHQIQEKYQKFYRIRLAEEKAKLETILKAEISRKLTDEMELKYKDKSNEAEELRKQNKVLQEQLLEMNKNLRELRTENEKKRLDLEKKINEEQEKFRREEKNRIEEEYKLKILEKDKKLDDAMKLAEDYKRKLEQGSQQLQGEVLELEIEEMFKREFPYDEITPVPKGVKGADVMQIVRNKSGRVCGQIIWELKRTRSWSGDWITKLREDQRVVKADIAVIISQKLPDGIRNFGLENGVWVGNYESIVGLALILRTSLMELYSAKISNVNRQNKMEVLYSYFSGIEFKQRIEAVLESYSSMQEDLEKEKRWFGAKWAREEKNIRKVLDSMTGMYGDLQSMLGKALPEVKGLMLSENAEAPVENTLF